MRGNADREPSSALAASEQARRLAASARSSPGWPLDGARSRSTGSGRRLFCHATPRQRRGDLHPATPDDAARGGARGRRRETSSSAGHVHVQVDRARRRAAVSSTPAASACRTRAARARTGRCSGPDVELRRTRLRPRRDGRAPIRAIGVPGRRAARPRRLLDPADPAEAIGLLRDAARVARSFVREARRRVGPKRDRIRPIIERLADEHPDATIALRFAIPLELLVSVMLSAQTTDVNVNRVTERLFAKYRRPEDYLAVPQEELERDIYATGFFRQKAKSLRGHDADAARGVRRRGPAPARASSCGCPASARKTANVVAAELGHAAGDRRRHARPAPLAAARPHAEGGPGEDRARPDAARAARGLGPLPAPADLARAPRLPRAAARAARTASSTTSARRAASEHPSLGAVGRSAPPSSGQEGS